MGLLELGVTACVHRTYRLTLVKPDEASKRKYCADFIKVYVGISDMLLFSVT
jgi:hypothetical protein